ncbi:MAG: ferrous iron transport protein B [Lentisphaerae bacterium RIFOXYB12_FULL_65_16]|nr:MAG: ferrous iron transport protein B [Lentisphaerae bacterium RIFOXYA12_64_32]OGV93098.1 MAG: ferrous iron transport protein B [Lentisphaerae bacterium RIFOXYB12_FULL_65_16]
MNEASQNGAPAAPGAILAALAGNPNSGKTTVFNNLTGARQHVGNYPGVTVEKKEGHFRHGGRDVHVIDLPGTYSLTAYTPEEAVARNVIIEERPAVVVDIVDASNLERNLYLTTQLMELEAPLVLVLNMSDVARQRGHAIDVKRLSALFNVRIVETVGHRSEGMDQLKDAILEVAAGAAAFSPAPLHYGDDIERELAALTAVVGREGADTTTCRPRWVALKLLENDEVVRAQASARMSQPQADALMAAVRAARDRLAAKLGDDAEILIADRRYGFISGACQEAVKTTVESRHSTSDRIDMVMTHRVLSIPIFLAMMYAVFKLTFTLGEPPMGWIEALFGWLGGVVAGGWAPGSESLLKSLLVDGIIGGVGGVIVFLPNILLLFLAIAILEDSGYMARAAFIMDRFMHQLGLHGKSFIPLLIGFGCTVPAIMATRTLETRRDRLITMLVAPLISCGARLPIYALIIPAFFPAAWHARMLWIIYLIGIGLAVVCARLLGRTLFRGESTPFVMELPPYRWPTLKGIAIHMWERGQLYLRKAGTIILGVSVIMWALATFPRKQTFEHDHEAQVAAVAVLVLDDAEKGRRVAEIEQARQAEELAYTIAGRIGHALEPVLAPLGFDWRIGTGLIGAFAAKEVFVAQMGIVFALGEAGQDSTALREKLRANYTPLQAFCIMLFCLVSAPCMATIAVTRRESNSWKWALFQLGGLTALAYVLTLIVFQVGCLLGLGAR